MWATSAPPPPPFNWRARIPVIIEANYGTYTTKRSTYIYLHIYICIYVYKYTQPLLAHTHNAHRVHTSSSIATRWVALPSLQERPLFPVTADTLVTTSAAKACGSHEKNAHAPSTLSHGFRRANHTIILC